MERNFFKMLDAKWAAGRFICVDLDTDYDKIPDHLKNKEVDCIRRTLFLFNKEIIDVTKDLICAYKINSAFYEAYGSEGISALEETIEYIRINCAEWEVPVILDAKRGDIDNTNNGYVKFAYDIVQADAITLHPTMGHEAMRPFLERKDKGAIILCRTSNKGAGEFQDLPIRILYKFWLWQLLKVYKTKRLFEVVARNVKDRWNYNGNCLVVVDATYPAELKIVRVIIGNIPILVPAVGKQGGTIKDVMLNGLDKNKQGLIISSSRDVIYASNGLDFACAARIKVKSMNREINNFFSGQ